MVDLLVTDADHLVTMDKKRRVIRDGSVAVQGGRILQVGKSKDLKARYGHRAERTLSAKGKLVLPGMVEGHIHHTQHLARGWETGCSSGRGSCISSIRSKRP